MAGISAPSRDVGTELASENRAMLGRRGRQYSGSIGATEDNAARRFAAARTGRTLREGALRDGLDQAVGDRPGCDRDVAAGPERLPGEGAVRRPRRVRWLDEPARAEVPEAEVGRHPHPDLG